VCAILCFEIMLQFREYTEVNPETNKGVSRNCKGDRSLPQFGSQTKVASYTRARYRGAHSISHTHTLVASICSSKQPPTRPGPTCSAAISVTKPNTQHKTTSLANPVEDILTRPTATFLAIISSCALCMLFRRNTSCQRKQDWPKRKGADTDLPASRHFAGAGERSRRTAQRHLQYPYTLSEVVLQKRGKNSEFFAGSTQRGSRAPGCGRAYSCCPERWQAQKHPPRRPRPPPRAQ